MKIKIIRTTSDNRGHENKINEFVENTASTVLDIDTHVNINNNGSESYTSVIKLTDEQSINKSLKSMVQQLNDIRRELSEIR